MSRPDRERGQGWLILLIAPNEGRGVAQAVLATPRAELVALDLALSAPPEEA